MTGQQSVAPDPLVLASLDAYKIIRKLLAAGDKHQGNFYFASDTRAQKAAIIVTLSTRDKDGSKAHAQGRPLRKQISGSKFARGRVRTVNKRLWLEVVAGNAPATLLSKAFKKAFQQEELAQLKRLLQKAKFGNPDTDPSASRDSPDDQEAAAIAQAAMAELDSTDRADVAALLQENNDLAAINQELERAFLSQQDADAEEAEERRQVMAELTRLSRDSPGDPQIQELRYGLTEMIYQQPGTGDDAFPAVGEPLSADMVQILQTQLGSGVDQLLQQLRAMAAAVATAHAEATALGGSQRATLLARTLPTLLQHPERMQRLLDQIHHMTR
jgi:hypothetical protein